MAILSQILIICMLCGWGVSAFALSMHHQGSNRSTTQDTSSSSLPSAARRAFVIGSASFLAGIGTAAPANALKQRNEALCGTGFFTNIAQYKCTEIGDISDEGKSKAMNRNDMQSVDSLLSKFGNIEVVEGVKDTSASLSSSAKTKANEKSEALASDRKGS